VAGSRAAIIKSLEHLYSLGALTDEGKLSDPLGIQMARFPLEPLYAKAMIVSTNFQCSEEMLTAVAMLSAESIFFTPREKLKEVKLAQCIGKIWIYWKSLHRIVNVVWSLLIIF
jgi:ATP-dependent RNA helicase DHX8/PRP22